jgi:hypothetical protein
MAKINRKAQEEIVGFAVIVIIVAIILVVILAFTLNRGTGKATFQTSYQAESFIHAVLQYTSDCSDGFEFMPIQELVISCSDNEQCSDGRASCDVLNETVKNIIVNSPSWAVGENNPIKGYELLIGTDTNSILDLKKGNESTDSRGSIEAFARSGINYQMTFKAYY